ncbi:MAG: Proline-tRNA ligase [Parcubacteria group bacterium GW2011_GWA2_44_12]|nr:MAG: Proline-tRNA ligase [Parcubacteria group bacterium GW2011_GWA2_44_12]
MRQSLLFTKTLKNISADSQSRNQQFLVRGGFVQQVMAGVYAFLPLGYRVIRKIETIVREEMSAVFGQEVFLPALHPKNNWVATGRWDTFDAVFKLKSRQMDIEYALAPSHEEVVVPLAKQYIHSYKDLPFAVYQIQTKFRDELRAKSGLLRGREFIMKDLYSFHATPDDLARYYEEVSRAYVKIFFRMGLKSLLVEASGGTFSKKSHEFQIAASAGEDTIYYCSACSLGRNEEVVTEADKHLCLVCGKKTVVLKTSEVGNIFKLNTKFSDPFGLKYEDKEGVSHMVYMGCYGIGISRLMGVIAEVFNDDRGLIWPSAVAPYRVHLLSLNQEKEEVAKRAVSLYDMLVQNGVEVLFDDRDRRAGEKFAESDLLGIPLRAVVSEKSGDKVEVKERKSMDARLLSLENFLAATLSCASPQKP